MAESPVGMGPLTVLLAGQDYLKHVEMSDILFSLDDVSQIRHLQ